MNADLDDPVWSSLTGVHADLAEVVGSARCYPRDVAAFAAFDRTDPGALDDLRELARSGPVGLVGTSVPPPPGLTEVFRMAAPRFFYERGAGEAAWPTAHVDEIVELGAEDWDEMVALTELTRPGPFFSRTALLGTYLGIRRAGRLVAMAGERMRPVGATEISAVCTHPEARGGGLGTALTLELVGRIRGRGEQPFLHTAPDNETAQRLYRSLGFVQRGTCEFVVLQG